MARKIAWERIKQGAAFKNMRGETDIVYFVAKYDGDYVFEYVEQDHRGSTQKFGIFGIDCLTRESKKDKRNV